MNDRFLLAPPAEAKFKRTRVARLSPENAIEQVINHDDLRLRDYRRLPDIIRHGEIFKDGPNRVAIYRDVSGGCIEHSSKRTPNNELFPLSFHIVERRHLKAIRKRTDTSPK